MEDDSYEDCLKAAFATAVVVYMLFKKKRQRSVVQLAAALALLEDDGLMSEDDDREERSKRPRQVYLRPNYEDSAWGVMLREGKLRDPCSKQAKAFRRRFRVPYPVFELLVDLVQNRRWFPSSSKDVAGRQCIPIELKILAALRILGCGACFDDISQSSLISESTVHVIFHTFCARFTSELYREYVNLPTGDDQRKVMEHYHMIGLSGAIGSIDVTRVKWDRCPHSLQRSYTGKKRFPTIAYQATVDFTGRLLGTTRGFAGAQNDETIVHFDLTAQKVREDRRYTEQTFELKRADGTAVQHKGNYLITDHSYYKWRVLMHPTQYPRNAEDTRFSKWLHIVRKDVECFFRRLKGRFRILKLGSRFHQKEDIDNIWFTCCILHNILHDFDGLDKLEEGVDWAGEDGLHDAWIADPLRDDSTVGAQTSNSPGDATLEVETEHSLLRQALLESFTYRHDHDDITWLARSV